MQRLLRLSLNILFIYCLTLGTPSVAKPAFIDLPQPPPGFESTTISQHLRVSVLLLEQHIGFFYIDVYQGQLKFHAPEQVLSQLTGIKPKAVLRLLKQSFPINVECLSDGLTALPAACEQLTQQSAYVIYDPKQETVHLFLASVYFKKLKSTDDIDFISNSTEGWSYLNKLGAAGSFNTEAASLSPIYATSPNYYNLYSNNVLAYGNSSIIGNLTQNNGINNGQRFQVPNLYFQDIVRDKIYTGGYIINPTSPFFQTQIITGLGVKTTLETVKNIENITATPLVIFVPQASQVSIFKNEQLIFSQYLPAGYQSINTTGFPEGGYELIVKIGSNSPVRRFFNKGLFLPPLQAPQFYITGGYLTNGMILNNNDYDFLPKTLAIPVLQAGVNKRINERLALMSDVLMESHQGLFDFGPTVFIGNAFIKTAALITTESNYGFYTQFTTQNNRLNASLIATKIFYQDKAPDNFFLNNLVDNDSVSLSYRLSETDLIGVQANYNKSLDQPNSYNLGSFYQKFIGQYKSAGFFFNAGYNHAIHMGNSYFLSLSMNFSQGQFAGTESLAWQNQNKASHHNQLAEPMIVQGSTVYSQQNEMGIGSSYNEMHTLSSTVTSLAGIYNYTAHQGVVSAYANSDRIKGERSSLGYGGSLDTELALNENGINLNGLERGNTSGIIAQVYSSNPEDRTAQFALMDATNRRIAVIPVNKTVFISIPGFTDQNYTLINQSNSDYFIKNSTQHMTLYPGNIGSYTWEVEKRIIVLGRALTKDNRPLANTWIHANKNGIFSDEEGYFQLELAQNITSLAAESAQTCQIHLPKLIVDKSYLSLGDVLCS